MAVMKDVKVTTGITALAGGANSASTPLLAPGVSVVATCATSADSVRIPSNLAPGTLVIVRNNGAAPCAVFPPTGGAHNGGSADTAFTVTNAKVGIFACVSTNGTGLAWVAGITA